MIELDLRFEEKNQDDLAQLTDPVSEIYPFLLYHRYYFPISPTFLY